MLTLSETVKLMADSMYSNWMSGNNHWWRIEGGYIVCKIFDISNDDLNKRVMAVFEDIKEIGI